METPLPVDQHSAVDIEGFEGKFKALADQKRLQILFELCRREEVCVCELSDRVGMQQSKLSYHLKILLDANLILKKTKGTWSYYSLNHEEMNHLLSPSLCCLFRDQS
ncbi:ArsR/SmtB family transcription factor [Gorillibacterium timonense]|uniref:ArsR/SmtB family transcription factor n=1 Tax=Gorillibacterium timonense TaxID=1689269 RepID=UPI00071C3127|nr:metalloregulator ArsR/SmtB family transcription factor [Gorillibacterium timonense]